MKPHPLFLSLTLLAAAASLAPAAVPVGMSGTVASVFAGPDPAIDNQNPPPPANPAFEAFFAPGQNVHAFLTYDLGAPDWYDEHVAPSPKIGIYQTILGGSVTVAGVSYSFNGGNVNTQIMNGLGEDQLGFDAVGPFVVNQPITASSLSLTFGIARPGMLPTDELPATVPPSWTRGFGHIRFGTSDGNLYELQFNITSVTNVPEPPATMLLALAVATAVASRLGYWHH